MPEDIGILKELFDHFSNRYGRISGMRVVGREGRQMEVEILFAEDVSPEVGEEKFQGVKLHFGTYPIHSCFRRA